VDFSDATIQGTLDRATLRGSKLVGSTFLDVSLLYADLRGALLDKTSLRGSDLSGADLRGALLRRVNLERTRLVWTEFDGGALLECNTNEARFAKPLAIMIGPRGASPPRVEPQPLYRAPTPSDALVALLAELPEE
jgi:uncharacterized protein YjbI with pentapeptide repeats